MSKSKSPLHDELDPCAGCGAGDGRRQFLRDAALMVTGTLVALGLAPARAAGLPMRFVTALGALGTEKTYPLPPSDAVNIDKKESVIITRYQSAVYAFSLACPHQETALRWLDTDKEFKCPKHNSTFHADGVFIPNSGRATRAMDRFAVRIDGANVAVDLDKLFQQDKDSALWKAAVIQL